MMKYIATFYSHYGAIQYRKNCEKMDLEIFDLWNSNS
jgi:hypothetical protein